MKAKGFNRHRHKPGVKRRNKRIWRHYLQALALCYVSRSQLVEHVAKSLSLPVSTVQEVISGKCDLVGCYDG
jgi:energy-converting hydrogenase A subunit M